MNSSLPNNEMIPSSCDIFALLGGRLHQPSPLTQAVLNFIIVIHFITFPFTAVLNALVMLFGEVKTPTESPQVEHFTCFTGID